MNPYNCTRPGNLFEGYEDLRRNLLEDLGIGKSFAILGGRRCGKTSLLLQLQKDLKSQGIPRRTPVPCFVDMQSLGRVSPGILFRTIYKQVTREVEVDSWTKEKPGREYEYFLELLDGARPSLDRIYGPNWLMVLLIDELDSAVTTLPDDQFFQNLRNFLMVSRFNDQFRLVGSGVKEMAKLISSGSSPLNNLCHVYVRVLAETEVEALIAHGFVGGMPGKAKEVLIEVTGRHPYLLQGLLEILKKQPGELSPESVRDACRDWCRQHKDFRRWYDGFSPAERAVYQILAQAPGGSASCEEICGRLAPILRREHEDALTTLSFHGVIDESDPDRPKLSGTMFRDWFLQNADEAVGAERRNQEILASLLESARSQTEAALPSTRPAIAVRGEGAAEREDFLVPYVPDHELLGKSPVGKGSYGAVWLARTLMGTHRAIKVVYRSRFEEERPFAREFEGIKKYEPISRTHPGLVQILQVGLNEANQYFYYVMEAGDDEWTGEEIDASTYAPRTLSQFLTRRGPLPLEECVPLAVALADALRHLHKNKLVHRDIKPANIIFVRGAPKLADIGLVTEMHSQAGEVTWIGTEGYIPPEGPGTAAADVYSLGKVLYQMSTGLDRKSFPALPIDSPATGKTRSFRGLNDIILKACSQDMQKRYPSGSEMYADLLSLEETLARDCGESPSISFWSRLTSVFRARRR
jgi:hypothetical protein